MSSSDKTSLRQLPATAELGESLVSAADSLFESELFSDIKIICGDGVQIPAHSIVLFSQSSFFQKALTVNMKEKLEGVIRLPEESALVRNMLQYFYTASYESRSSVDEAKLYAMAIKYDNPSLKKRIQASFERSAKEKLRVISVPETDETELIVEEDFIAAAEIIYENTFDQSDKLRWVCADALKNRTLELMKYPDEARMLIERITTVTQQELARDVVWKAFDSAARFDQLDSAYVVLACPTRACAGAKEAMFIPRGVRCGLIGANYAMTCGFCEHSSRVTEWKVVDMNLLLEHDAMRSPLRIRRGELNPMT